MEKYLVYPVGLNRNYGGLSEPYYRFHFLYLSNHYCFVDGEFKSIIF